MVKRIGIVGTRFSALHSPSWREQVRQIIDALPDGVEVVVNGAPGTDEEAARLAEARGLTVEVLFRGEDFPDDPHFLLHRNSAVVERSDEVYAVWDGNSPGTRHAITLAKHQGVPVHVVNVLHEDWQRFS